MGGFPYLCEFTREYWVPQNWMDEKFSVAKCRCSNTPRIHRTFGRHITNQMPCNTIMEPWNHWLNDNFQTENHHSSHFPNIKSGKSCEIRWKHFKSCRKPMKPHFSKTVPDLSLNAWIPSPESRLNLVQAEEKAIVPQCKCGVCSCYLLTSL